MYIYLMRLNNSEEESIEKSSFAPLFLCQPYTSYYYVRSVFQNSFDRLRSSMSVDTFAST